MLAPTKNVVGFVPRTAIIVVMIINVVKRMKYLTNHEESTLFCEQNFFTNFKWWGCRVTPVDNAILVGNQPKLLEQIEKVRPS